MKLILCDVDNVISDDGWRVDFIRTEERNLHRRFHDYHSACLLDSAHNLDLLRVRGTHVVLLTAMPQAYAHFRERWLKMMKVRYHRILYRPHGNHSEAVEVKREMLRRLAADGLDLSKCIAAYDDRPEVVSMYLAHGLPGRRVFIREYKEALPWRKDQTKS